MIITNKIVKDYIESNYDINLSLDCRKEEVINMRSTYYLLCLKYVSNSTYANIGEEVNRTHASVINGVTKFSIRLESNLKVDDFFKEKYMQIHNLFYDTYKVHLEKSDFKDLHTRENIYLMRKIKRLQARLTNIKKSA